MLTKILLAGGQGIQTLSDLICRACFVKDLIVSHIPNYGLEQRGGVSLAYIKVSEEYIVYPKFSKPDILLIMSDQARQRTEQYQKPGVKVIDIENYKDRLKQENIPMQSYNIFFLGVVTSILQEKGIVSSDDIFVLLEKKLCSKPGWEENKRAFNLGKS